MIDAWCSYQLCAGTVCLKRRHPVAEQPDSKARLVGQLPATLVLVPSTLPPPTPSPPTLPLGGPWPVQSPQGYEKTGPYRAQFLVEAVSDLRSRLRAAGSDLVVRVGRPEEVLGELVRKVGGGMVYCHGEPTYEARQVRRGRGDRRGELAGLSRQCWEVTPCLFRTAGCHVLKKSLKQPSGL